MTEQPDQFREDSRKQAIKSAQEGQTLLKQDMDWSLRAGRYGWGKATIGEVNDIFLQKTEQAYQEIKMLQSKQAGEKAELNNKTLLKVQEKVMSGIRDRFDLMMSISVVESPTKKKDDKVSTNADLMELQSRGLTLMKSIDVQSLVYQALPSDLQDDYLGMIGRNLEVTIPDYFEIIQKIDRAQPLTEAEKDRLAADLLRDPEGAERTAVTAILGTLKPGERMNLLRRSSTMASADKFGRVLVSLTACGYLTKLQAYELLDERIAANPAEAAILEKAKATLGGAAVEKMQQTLITRQKEGTRRVGRMSYGHKNRARGLLTAKGIAGMFLTVNGALVMGVNFAVDPAAFYGNPAFYLGLGEVAAGMELTQGFGGVLPKPTELAALATKDRAEEKDDKAQLNLRDFRNELFNRPDNALFYANYVERIVATFNKKLKTTPMPDIKITLEDLGIKSKEDLPVQLRDLWEHRLTLEADLSKWAIRFHRSSGNGIGRATAEGQLTWLQDERTEATGGKGIGKPFEIYEKPHNE